jgi:queuine/archaeosine tRNA-ribosyltransferase
MITMTARHAYDNFITKGIYVHFLGLGSFNRMIILIRNKISTFDSSSVLQGARANEFVNPITCDDSLQILSEDFYFNKQFCMCPVCSKVDYNELIQQDKKSFIGRHFIAHNLWHVMKNNVFLDAIPLNRYTEIIKSHFKVSENIINCLEFCDECDKFGFNIAYGKYKHFLKIDETKQRSLF